LPQDGFIRSPPGAASRKCAIHDHTRQALNTVLLCSGCDMSLMHVENFDIVGRARDARNQVNRLAARRTSGGKNLDLLLWGHASFSFSMVEAHSPRF
jgi:hypothetical protein